MKFRLGILLLFIGLTFMACSPKEEDVKQNEISSELIPSTEPESKYSDTITITDLNGNVQRFSRLKFYGEIIKELKRVEVFNRQVANQLGLKYPPEYPTNVSEDE